MSSTLHDFSFKVHTIGMFSLTDGGTMVSVVCGKVMPAKNPRVSFVLPPDIKRDLEALAERDHRSMSNYILKLIIQDIEQAKEDGRLGGSR